MENGLKASAVVRQLQQKVMLPFGGTTKTQLTATSGHARNRYGDILRCPMTDGIIAGVETQAARGKDVTSHPNRYIREALKYAEEKGWTIRQSGPRAHAWGVIYCGFGHRECWMAIYSTPRNPERHARDIQRTVDRCPGA
jgi:hypothetical protein